MKDSIVELAGLFKARDNPAVQGICIGKVISINPLKVTANTFILDKNRLVVAKHLLAAYHTSAETVGNHGGHSHTVSDVLKIGDKVIIIPSADDAKYYAIDKVGDI